MLPERNLRSRTVPASPQRPRPSSDMTSPSLERQQLQPQDRQEAQGHDDTGHSVLRLRLHPHPSLAQTHQRVATVSLCYHNGYWTSPGLGDDTIHFYDQDRVCHVRDSHPASLAVPSPPNYVIECNDINLWPSEDEDDSDISSSPSLPPPPPEHNSSASRLSPRFNGCIILWSVLGLILFATVTALPSLKTYSYQPEQPRFVSDKLPVLERYHHICLQEANLARETVDTVELRGYVKALHQSSGIISESCSKIYIIGKIWDEKNGLTMQDSLDYREYRRTNKDKPLTDGGIYTIDLCDQLDGRVYLAVELLIKVINGIVYKLPSNSKFVFMRLITPFRREYFRVIMPPPCHPTPIRNDWPDNSTWCEAMPIEWLAQFKDKIESEGLRVTFMRIMERIDTFDAALGEALDKIDLVLHIAATHDPPPPQRSWFFFRRAPPKLSTLLDPIKQIRETLVQVNSTFQAFIERQEAILLQEDNMVSWLTNLLEWALDRDTMYHLPNKTNVDTAQANPWAIWRPRNERETFGQWCTYPDCPKPRDDGDNVLVRLHLRNADDTFRFLFSSLKFLKELKDDKSYFWNWRADVFRRKN